MAIDTNEEQENNQQSDQFEGEDPVERVNQRVNQSQLNEARAQDKKKKEEDTSLAESLVGSTETGGGMVKTYKTGRRIIQIIKGVTAFGGSFGDVVISIPTFIVTGSADLLMSYLVPGWKIDKFEKYFTILFLLIFLFIGIFIVALVMGGIKYSCTLGDRTIDFCEFFS